MLADTRRLADCFPSVDYFEQRGTPFVVAVNCFDGARRFPAEIVRSALDLDPDVPVMLCDARQRASCRDALVTLVEHAIRLLSDGLTRSAPPDEHERAVVRARCRAPASPGRACPRPRRTPT